MSKLEFKIVEIPEGESRRTENLLADDLDLSPYAFEEGRIVLDFYRALHFIRVRYDVDADIELVCDRSLEPFIESVNTHYEVIFKTEVQQETEDEEAAVRTFNFSANTFSIEQEVRDSLLLEVPMQKIHPKYLNEEGNYKKFETKSFGEGPDKEDEQSIDPRWEKLKEL